MAEYYTTLFLTSIALFLLGILAGLATKDELFTDSNLRIAVGILITIVWAMSIGAGILIPSYTVSPLVHAIMGGVVGYLFTEDGITINIGGT
jgi:hypothetical protein